MNKITIAILGIFLSMSLAFGQVYDKYFVGLGVGSTVSIQGGDIMSGKHKISASYSNDFGAGTSYAVGYSYLFDLDFTMRNIKPFLGLSYVHFNENTISWFNNGVALNFGVDYTVSRKLFISLGSNLDLLGISANFEF